MKQIRTRRGRDRMVAGFTTTLQSVSIRFPSPIKLTARYN